jgi:GWxTD domain-containing protein
LVLAGGGTAPAADRYEKWLKEEVVWIIGAEEKKAFEQLRDNAARDRFIEEFWQRRDPTPGTPANEYREEHAARLKYVTEHFREGSTPGWKTDRGRVYIIHGPPNEIESKPAGGAYRRQRYEGGGATAVYPFEVWRYRHLEGLGSDIEIEFVDPSMTGEYRIARSQEDKDAFLHIPGLGLTTAEKMGLAERKDRPFFSPGPRENYPMLYTRPQDNPFQRYETEMFVQRPKELKYPDLKQLVEVDVSFGESLPFETRHDYFRLNENQVLTPVTLQIDNRHLTFKEEHGRHRARLAIYGVVTSLSNRLITEFEEETAVEFPAGALERGLQGRSMFQRILPVDRNSRYRLDLVVKDLHSGRAGVLRKAIIPPSYPQGEPSISGLMVAEFIRELGETPKDNPMFVLGDVWVRPSLNRVFPSGSEFGLYLQVYDVGIDQTSLEPELEVTWSVSSEGRTVFTESDDRGVFVQYFSPQRVVLINGISLKDYAPGEYRIEVRVRDRILNREISGSETFRVTGPTQASAN